MKILKAHFENFEGFYTGMNLRVIDLDFTKCNSSRFIMIFGKNFSGKSTLISQLQPFPGSNDERKKTIISGEEGKKVIEYLRNDGEEFKIEILYPIQNGLKKLAEKCFFYEKKDNKWININKNGGIESYVSLLEEKLLITKDFFAVGRLGGIANFVDFSRSDRKKYISSFLPNLDPFLEAHEIVSRKYTAAKKMSSTFADELLKLKPVEECAVEIVRINRSMEDLNTNIARFQENLGLNKGKIDKILEETDSSIPELRIFARTGKNTILEDIERESLSLSKMKSNIEDGLTEDIASEKSKAIGEEIIDESRKESVLLTNIQNKQRLLTEQETEYEKTKSSLLALEKQEERVIEAKRNLAEINSFLSNYIEEKKKFSSPVFKHFDSMNQNVMGTFREQVMELRMFILDIRKKALSVGLDFSVNLDKSSFLSSLSEAKHNLSVSISLLNEIEQNEKIIIEKTPEAKREEILSKRPKGCIIDSCPFIADAVECEGASIVLNRARNRLNEIISGKDKAKTDIEFYKEKVKFMENFENMFEVCKTKFSSSTLLRLYYGIYAIATEEESFFKALQTSENELAATFDISKVIEYVNLIGNTEQFRNKKAEAEKYLEGMKSSVDLVTELLAKKKDIEKNIIDTKKDLTVISENYSSIKLSLEKKKDRQKYLDLSIFAIRKIKEKEDLLKILMEKEIKMKHYLSEIEDGRVSMQEISESLKRDKDILEESQKKQMQLNHEIEKRKETEEKLEILNRDFALLESVRQATDIVKGIPVYLSASYLEDIRLRANKLLDISFNGSFSLDKFIINEKDFTMPVLRGNGSRLDDASLGSGAELSFIKEAISFAIIEKSLGGYNILYLDELDSVLDEDNRRSFIQMLNRQIEDLGIEQVFIISHNREFMGENLNMVLLREHGIDTEDGSMMSNKTVIFEYGSTKK
jgi:hypothetical protein